MGNGLYKSEMIQGTNLKKNKCGKASTMGEKIQFATLVNDQSAQ